MHLKLGGVITVAAGIGVSMLSHFVGRVIPIAYYPILSIAAVAICVGIGLLIGFRMLAETGDERASRRELGGMLAADYPVGAVGRQ